MCVEKQHQSPASHKGLHMFHKSQLTNYSSSRLDRKDSEVSPLTKVPRQQPDNSRGNIAPWEEESPSGSQRTIPSISREPPTATPGGEKSGQMPSSVFSGAQYNDSSENVANPSPGPNGKGYGYGEDDRRPSIASADTMSSTGSKSSMSGKIHKKLHGFFGEEYKGLQEDASRQGSETSSMQSGLPPFAPGGGGSGWRNRNNSVGDSYGSRPPSPGSSRPRTPAQQAPSSDVTPWVYQDTQVRTRPHTPFIPSNMILTRRCRTCPSRHPPITAMVSSRSHLSSIAYTSRDIAIIAAMRRSTTSATASRTDRQRVGRHPTVRVAMDNRPWLRL